MDLNLESINKSYQEKIQTTLKLISELKREPTVDPYSLWTAINVSRSLRMFEEASTRRLSHMVVGADHAADLKALGKANVSFIGVTVSDSETRKRLASYAAHKTLLERLWKIAEKK